jgi:cell wall-associated NlpC family hydrolase
VAAPTGNDIASAALRFKGTRYTWKGYLPSTGWDCSGFVGYILGHDFGMTLPGGWRWSGRSHGPVAAMYKMWGNASTVSSASPGDLCCWVTHVGFAISQDQMISAYDTQLGTAVTAIQGAGPPGEPLSIRKINAVGASMPSGPLGQAAQGCTVGMILLPILIARGVIARGRTSVSRETARPGD